MAKEPAGSKGASSGPAGAPARSGTLRLGLLQTHATDDPADNLARTLALIDRAVARGANVVCTPELFLSPYFCQRQDPAAFDLAEPVPGPTTEVLAETAREHGIVVVASLFEKRARGLYHNTVAVLDADGSFLGKYRKMHIPHDPRFEEKYYFAPGDLGWKVFPTRFGSVGTLICWDQWYPEAARATALRGADLLLYPTAIGTWRGEAEMQEEQHEAWQVVQRGHAVANNCYVAAVNRVGREDELQFWGRSFVAGPTGAVIAQAGDQEEVLVVELDLDQIEVVRRGWPFLRDRRVEAYLDLQQRYLDE